MEAEICKCCVIWYFSPFLLINTNTTILMSQSELEEYKKIHKQTHAHVSTVKPKTAELQKGWSKKLGKWVHKQRQEYKLYTEGKHSQMTAERIEELGKLEFKWNAPKPSKKTTSKPKPVRVTNFVDANGYGFTRTRRCNEHDTYICKIRNAHSKKECNCNARIEWPYWDDLGNVLGEDARLPMAGQHDPILCKPVGSKAVEHEKNCTKKKLQSGN